MPEGDFSSNSIVTSPAHTHCASFGQRLSLTMRRKRSCVPGATVASSPEPSTTVPDASSGRGADGDAGFGVGTCAGVTTATGAGAGDCGCDGAAVSSPDPIEPSPAAARLCCWQPATPNRKESSIRTARGWRVETGIEEIGMGTASGAVMANDNPAPPMTTLNGDGLPPDCVNEQPLRRHADSAMWPAKRSSAPNVQASRCPNALAPRRPSSSSAQAERWKPCGGSWHGCLARPQSIVTA